MRYHKSWHSTYHGSASHSREEGDLSLSTRITDGPASTKDRNVELKLTREEVRQLIATLSMWYPDEITTAATVIREADQMAESGGYNDLRYGRRYGYLRTQMLNSALSALPVPTNPDDIAANAEDGYEDDGFSEDGEFKQ